MRLEYNSISRKVPCFSSTQQCPADRKPFNLSREEPKTAFTFDWRRPSHRRPVCSRFNKGLKLFTMSLGMVHWPPLLRLLSRGCALYEDVTTTLATTTLCSSALLGLLAHCTCMFAPLLPTAVNTIFISTHM